MEDTEKIKRFAIILTHNRHDLLKDCINAIQTQVSRVFVIDNASNPHVSHETVQWERNPPTVVEIIYDMEQPPNLYRLWNVGLDLVADRAALEGLNAWDVAILCDDTAPYQGWVENVATSMRVHNAAAASNPGIHPIHTPFVKTSPDGDLMNRMCAWAFVVAGERGIRADTDFRWWWGDSDFDWRLRQNGGVVLVPGEVVHNIHPNDYTYRYPGLSEQAGQDGITFASKWGHCPW